MLATDRGIACVTVDYDALRGIDDPTRAALLTPASRPDRRAFATQAVGHLGDRGPGVDLGVRVGPQQRLAPVKGVFAAQEIKPQARVLAADRGIDCVTVYYAVLKGTDDPSARLF